MSVGKNLSASNMSDSALKVSPIKTNRNVFCSVFCCSSRACKDPEIRFHKFPKLDKSFVEIGTRNGNKEMIDRRRLETCIKNGTRSNSKYDCLFERF